MTDWLIDTSALSRIGTSPDAQTWADRIDRALVRSAVVRRLEIGYSARSGPDRTYVPGCADPREVTGQPMEKLNARP